MSFGFSVGDFITVLQLASNIRKQLVDAPSQFKTISNEVRSLVNVLRDVEDVLPERELTSQQKTELENVTKGCFNVLTSLNETLKKYQDLDSDPKTFGRKPRRVWKRLKWEPEDISELRNRITVNISLLNVFCERLVNQLSLATKDDVDRLHDLQDQEYRQVILNWLTPIDYALLQSDFIGRRQEGTGQWLLNSDIFKNWISQNKQTLFCPGIPGAGKTIITSIIVEHLWNKFQNDIDIGIAYVYCNYRMREMQKPIDLLKSLLKQLVQKQPSMPESIKSLYERHKDHRTSPSLNEISEVLRSIVANCSRIFIIIDALDECQASNGDRMRLLSEIFNLQAKTRANLFVTSRFIPDIVKEFKGNMVLEIRASDEDVLGYVNSQISRSRRLKSIISRYPGIQDTIRSKIVKVVDGMFLLAQICMDSLTSQVTAGDIMDALQDLPLGMDGLHAPYEMAMERIENQKGEIRKLAKQVLSWITCTKRPLTTLELRHALAVEVGQSRFDEDFLPDIEDIVSICAGLVIVDEARDIIRLAHYTMQDYFERTQISWFHNAQTDISVTCVTYLSFDIFAAGFCPTDEEFEARLLLYPLYDYAARNWGHHARTASIEVERPILGLLESEAKMSAANQAMLASRSYSGYSQRVPRKMTGVHLAAYFGLTSVIMALLKRHDPDIKDSYDRTPLSWAAEKGHEEVVQLLCDMGAELDCKDNEGRTPLVWAAANGKDAVARLLLDKGAKMEAEDNEGRTPFSWAAEKGHGAVIKLLLDKDTEVDSKDNEGRTPLVWAVANGHEAVARLLLKNGANMEAKDAEYDRTPLSWATENGHETVVRLLIKKGADIAATAQDGRTALHYAAKNGHVAVVQMLLERADVDAMSSNGTTALLAALEAGNSEVVNLLLFRDKVTFLESVRNGNLKLIKSLLAAGYHVDTTDSLNRTPLHHAILFGRLEIAKELLSSRATINPEDNDGMTPLQLAVRRRKREFVKLLLEKSARTEGITIYDWFYAFDKKPRQILVFEELGGKKSVNLIAENELNGELQKKPDETAKRLFLFTEDPDLIPGSKVSLNPDVLNISIEKNDPNTVKFSVAVWFSGGKDRTHEKCFKIPAGEKTTIRITWTISQLRKLDGEQYWKATDHYSTLPYDWIPDNGIDLFKDFVLLLEQKWLKLYELGEKHLTICRRNVLGEKGKSSELIDHLLEDAEEWVQLRSILQEQIDAARKFRKEYSGRDYEHEALHNLEETIDSFAENVNKRITRLDEVSQSLIQIEFNLKSIAEVQGQVDIGLSQSKLTNVMVDLTTALSQDSSNMKLIAILTALFLPGTFMAILLTTPMFKWPDPPDGQIIVRLPFEIYWAASLSVTLILGFGMYIWSVGEKPDKWPRTVNAVSWVSAGKLFALEVKKSSVDGSHHEKPEQDSSSKENAPTTEGSNDAANAPLPHAVPPNEKTTAGNSQSAEPKTVSTPDIEAAADSINTANQKGRPPRCTTM